MTVHLLLIVGRIEKLGSIRSLGLVLCRDEQAIGVVIAVLGFAWGAGCCSGG
jgi:hypothetical protein